MNILFIHSGTVITGAFTYARALERAWESIHRVYWANDGVPPTEQRGLVVGLSRRLFPNGLVNALRLTRYVREKNIHLLHAHSRRANLVAALVSRWTRVPYVVTVHMRTRARHANRVWPCWGERTIAICEAVETHLREVNNVPAERVHLIRNGIDMQAFRAVPAAASERPPQTGRCITILGRLSGKRWQAAQFMLSLIPEVARAFPDVHFQFVGWVDPVHEPKLQETIRRLNEGRRQPLVVVTGHVEDPRPLLRQSALVIGAGRSLMEAMAMELPVIAVGEQSAYGILTPDNFAEAQKTNFGDFAQIGENGFDAPLILQGIAAVLQNRVNVTRLKHWGRERIASDYDLTKVARQIERVYASINPPLRRPM